LSTITAPTPTQLPTGTWSIDPVHSQVGFAVDYLVGTFRGSFSPVEGTLAVAEDGTAELHGSAQATSVKVQDENLSTHLLSPEFFDAERTPEIRFATSDLRRDGDALKVSGELNRRHARDDCRSHAVRAELEPPPAERKAGAGQRRPVDRRALPGQGVTG